MTIILLGLAPVHLALCSKNSDCLRLLQQCGADMNIMDARSGRTALHHSVDIGDLTMAGVLISEVRWKIMIVLCFFWFMWSLHAVMLCT